MTKTELEKQVSILKKRIKLLKAWNVSYVNQNYRLKRQIEISLKLAINKAKREG